MRHWLAQYRDGRQSFVEEFSPEEGTRFEHVKRAGIKLTALITGFPSLETWKTLPRVNSPEMAWNGPDLDPDKIDKELTEILGESTASS